MEPSDEVIFRATGLRKQPNETKQQFANRVIVSTQGSDKFHRCYIGLVDELHNVMKTRVHSLDHLHLKGTDPNLKFNFEDLEKGFDIKHSLYVVPGGSEPASITMFFGGESFFTTKCNGDYLGMLERPVLEHYAVKMMNHNMRLKLKHRNC
jgi:hypothetical protein